eukprot:scaffold555047_cov42-Prasinocladus_malaysianus.AAC.1
MGMPDSLSADHVHVNRSRRCPLTLVEVGYCANLRLHAKPEQKLNKYPPLMTELIIRKLWKDVVALVVVRVGGAGTTLEDTATDLAERFYRPKWHCPAL